MATITIPVSTVGLVIPFVLTENAVAVSTASAMSVTWISHDGRQRPLSLLCAASAVFSYVVSGSDSARLGLSRGYLQVSVGTQIYFTASHFTWEVVAHL